LVLVLGAVLAIPAMHACAFVLLGTLCKLQLALSACHLHSILHMYFRVGLGRKHRGCGPLTSSHRCHVC
jgi:hypothetical protein